MNTFRLLFIFISSLSILFGCNCSSEHANSNKTSAISHDYHSTLQKQRNATVGKEIKSFSKIAGDTIADNPKILFIYNGYDCHSCIESGFETINRIDAILASKATYIIAVSANISHDQVRNDYPHYIFNDEHDEIRKELKYITTPCLIVLNKKNRVEDIFFITYDTDIEFISHEAISTLKKT